MNRSLRSRRFPAAAAAAALAATLLASCASIPGAAPRPLAAATPATLRSCEALAGTFAFGETAIESATPVAAGATMQGNAPIAAHCLVKGAMHKRKGSDGRDYAIAFEMRLPQAWNGRFFYQGNGGLDGAVQPARGALGGGPLTGALAQGFAVISSDAGHTGAQTPYFGMEPQSRLDYGWQAVAKLTPMAKALIASAYGKGPDRSYIGGCSNGGRHAMVAAARVGAEYDGYLVGAPGYRLPYAALAQIWNGAQLRRLATPGATVAHPQNPNATIPDLASGFTAQERRTVARAVLDKCDALDGARDGLVQATQACQAAFDLKRDVPTCTGARNGSCLTPLQKDAIASVYEGARRSQGQPIYAPFPWDPGIVGANWATWRFTNPITLDPLSVGIVFSVPPSPVTPFTEDIDARWQRLHATDATYRESGASLMMPPSQDDPRNMAPLAARGAKMVIYHGVSDAVFSAEDTRQWMLRLDRALDGRADGFARYFPVPGMNHCSGGPATDAFDLLAPLVRWVEGGVAPQAVTASARGPAHGGGANAELPADWSPTRTRPLCAHPTVARYNGSGNVEDAANFSCR
ncbi:tannase/feruloyl esterase family alpha/beta hydrolase [Ramlibacter sp.]|uniref:tannase/feruloyl esterase family alpha/beta hydrolase n=1 Tax=Ramlibacter sp. TaxID=1917967 RepID=UPI003D0E44AE